MRVVVESAIVQKNIKLLKKIVEAHLHPEYSKAPPDLSTFAARINCLTGELIFSEDTESERIPKSKKWKPVCLRVRLGLHPEENCFEVLEEESNEVLFQCDDLDPTASRVMAQMIEVLNEVVGAMRHHPDHVAKILQEIVHLELESKRPTEAEGDIVHEAWHQVGRLEAEDLLLNKAVGTFLFRKDRFAEILEEQLSAHFREPIRCITLTYLDPDEKVVDQTLVSRAGKWYVYEDDPALEDSSFSSMPLLLKSFKHHLLTPLLHH